MAAAAWSWVEKMLHDDHVTSAPSALRVSMSTAVWMVMCRQPAMRAPLKGCAAPNSSRRLIKPGISASARRISFRPHSARLMSFTLYGAYVFVVVSTMIELVIGSVSNHKDT